jgi:hypothetical protein
MYFHCCNYVGFLYPRSPEGEGGYTVLLLSAGPSQDIFRRIFLSNYRCQKSDIWSQASYRYAILWVAFLNPSDSYFLFADSKCITIILSGSTYSSQNVRQMSDKFESQHSLSLTIWSDILVLVGNFGRTWEWILKDFFLHFSRWICQTFCDRCVFVSVLSFRCVECAGT